MRNDINKPFKIPTVKLVKNNSDDKRIEETKNGTSGRNFFDKERKDDKKEKRKAIKTHQAFFGMVNKIAPKKRRRKGEKKEEKRIG